MDGTRQGVLSVQGIDFCIDTNGENHHTSKFNLMTRAVDRCLVVRRGQAFKLDILLNRPYDVNRDAISFIFYVSGMKAMQMYHARTSISRLFIEMHNCIYHLQM